MNFKQLGTTTQDELKSNPIVYTSESYISSMSYSGASDLVDGSTTFSDQMKAKIKKINGLVSLGNTDGVLKNIHIYSANAKTLDGKERICYLQQDGDDLLVTDYKGNRGAKYSALYNRLQEQLSNLGIHCESQNRYRIPFAKVDTFVNAVNIVIDERKNDAYELILLDEYESILISNKRYYYNKVEWQRKASSQNKELSQNSLSETMNALINSVKLMDDVVELNNFALELGRLSDAVAKKISYLDSINNV